MINLAKIWLKVADYSISKILLKFNENSKLFLASYFYRFKNEEINEKSLKTILECMLRLFAVLEIVETGYSTNKFKSFLFSENVKLSDSNISVEEIKNDFNYHISQNWNKIDIEKTLMYYDKSALVYLNEFLFSKENGIEFNLNSKCDIEHIMPSSGKNLQAIRADADINDDIEFKEIVNKLGNKILLEEDINRSIGNEWFRTKTSTKLKDKTGYIESSYPIAKSLVETYNNSEKPYWTKADILKATEKANNRIVKFIFGN